jgi:hypothetical protein
MLYKDIAYLNSYKRKTKDITLRREQSDNMIDFIQSSLKLQLIKFPRIQIG